MATDPPVIAFGGGEAAFQIELVPAGPVASYTVQVQGAFAMSKDSMNQADRIELPVRPILRHLAWLVLRLAHLP